MKKLLSICLVIVMLITAMPLGAFELKASASTSGTTGDCTWTLDGTVLTISGNGATADYYDYTELPWGDEVTKVVFEDGVTRIGERVFYWCTELTDITIPDSVISIGNEAFYNSGYFLDDNNWEDNVLYIDNHLIFAWEYYLSGGYTIKPGTLTIADSAFYDCTDLTEVIIPNTVVSIGEWAFSYCDGLTGIDIPSSVKSIGYMAFGHSHNLEAINLPDGLTYMGDDVFYNTEYYNNEDNWVNDLLYFDNFLICARGSSLQNCTVKEGTLLIASKAFSECRNLKSVTIPDSVRYINSKAFSECEYLTNVTVSSGNSNFTSVDGVLFNKNKTELICYPASKTGTSYTVPNGVKIIADGAFYSNKNLSSVTVSTGVTKIGAEAFGVCYALNIVIIQNGVQYIGDYAFMYCENMESIQLPDSIISIKESAFYACYSLTDVYYDGAKVNKDKMLIGGYNECLTDAKWHYPACDVHNFINDCDEECDNCGFMRSVLHSFEFIETVQPTCAEDGYDLYRCADCKKETGDNFKTALGHNYVGWQCERCEESIESDHPYANDGEKTWIINKPMAKSISVTFSPETFTENDYDFIIIHDKNGNLIGRYSGSALASKTITVQGDTFKIKLVSDFSENYYGFSITNVSYELYGDIDGDENVNLKDLITIARQVANWENLTVNEHALDVNGDGVVDLNDVNHLARYLAGWDVVLN